MNRAEKAVILLSGGLDSATTLAIAKKNGFLPFAISFRYGQRHGCEILAAKQIATQLGAVQHIICDLNLGQFGGSALTDDIQVPEPGSVEAIGQSIPVTYVPARNTVFLSFALAFAESLGTGNLFIGVNALDYSGYPDCRPEYIEAFQTMANLATKAAVEGTCPVVIHTPLIRWTKSQTIQCGLELGVDFGLTTSCYNPTDLGLACGRCDACLLRLRGFEQVGVKDPIQYTNG